MKDAKEYKSWIEKLKKCWIILLVGNWKICYYNVEFIYFLYLQKI